MKDIDKTKQNIKINEIDDTQRKELFNRFKDAGGKVLTEREQKRNMVIDRDKQKQHQQKLDQHFSTKRVPSVNRVVANKKTITKSAVKPTSSVDRLRIRMRLRIMGITGLNTVFFKNSFFKKFNDHYRPSLIGIQLIFLALFKKDPKTGNRIIRSLDKISPIYYELIEKSGNLYEPYVVDQILEGYRNFPNVPQSLSELRESLTALFRLLFILKPYENSILNSFEKSIDINNSYTEGKKDKNISKKELKNSLFIIFNKLYPRLHTVFCQYQGILFSESDKAIEDILSILQSEKPGNRKRMDETRQLKDESNSLENKNSDTNDENDNLSVNDSVREGLKLMYRLDNKVLRSIYDKKGEFQILNDSDKVLLTYMLFLEFEKEYSFILTTNKIKYNVDFSTNVKVDYKLILQDIFNQLNKSREAFIAYYERCQEYNKIFNQKPFNNNQYIAYSKRIDEIEKKKKLSGSASRMVIKSFMDNVIKELKVLIDDMNGQQKFISNPQDVIEFNFEIEGSKKLNNKKIFNAIEIVHNYASALSYRISFDGDLSGNLEFKDNENQIEVANDNNDNQINKDDRNKKKDEKKSSESLFDELDEII